MYMVPSAYRRREFANYVRTVQNTFATSSAAAASPPCTRTPESTANKEYTLETTSDINKEKTTSNDVELSWRKGPKPVFNFEGNNRLRKRILKKRMEQKIRDTEHAQILAEREKESADLTVEFFQSSWSKLSQDLDHKGLRLEDVYYSSTKADGADGENVEEDDVVKCDYTKVWANYYYHKLIAGDTSYSI